MKKELDVKNSKAMVAPILEDIKLVFTEDSLNSLIKEYKDIPPINPLAEDVTEQYSMTLSAYKNLKDVRISIEKRRKEIKQPSLDYGANVDKVAKKLQEIISPFEEKFKHEKTIYENFRKAEKQKKIDAEQNRISDIQARLDILREVPFRYENASSDDIKSVIIRVTDNEVTEELFEEYLTIGLETQKNAIDKLTEFFNIAKQAEEERASKDAEIKRIAKENEEIKRVADEREAKIREEAEKQKKIDAEQNRISDIQARLDILREVPLI